jgi:hypothetical protein
MHLTLHLTLVLCRDCILEGGDCLFPVAALPKLRSFEVDECGGVELYMLRGVMSEAVQGSALKIVVRDCGISRDEAKHMYLHIWEWERGSHTPRIKASDQALDSASSDDGEGSSESEGDEGSDGHWNSSSEDEGCHSGNESSDDSEGSDGNEGSGDSEGSDGYLNSSSEDVSA